MRVIEEFLRVYRKNIFDTGMAENSSRYLVKLDKDDLISLIEFSPKPDINACDLSEQVLIKKWYDWKLKVMNEFKELYNESQRSYNDYVGKRAGENDIMFQLVLGGHDIGNVVAFDPNRVIAQKTKVKDNTKL